MVCFWCIAVDCGVLGCDLLVWVCVLVLGGGPCLACVGWNVSVCVVDFGFGARVGCGLGGLRRFLAVGFVLGLCMVLLGFLGLWGSACPGLVGSGFWVSGFDAGWVGLAEFGWCCDCVVSVIYITDGSWVFSCG